ncbi:hypothetical protein NPIL_331021 [Nephila pilipes]|uniref:Uncharacterized protein n=1 Tax=Nephila pilipes TaxID=299642 RepID=A0A8X6QFB8_NEPPI|nr:hypothetical protein NPIL_331021 [Nephila pilipes]
MIRPHLKTYYFIGNSESQLMGEEGKKVVARDTKCDFSSTLHMGTLISIKTITNKWTGIWKKVDPSSEKSISELGMMRADQ